MIKRRITSVTAPKRKKKTPTPKDLAKRKAAKLRYHKNKAKILKAAKVRRAHLTLAEKEFNKKRAAFLRKSRHT